MIPRARLDIGWRDLVAGALACFRLRPREARVADIEALWQAAGRPRVLPALSVRSALDAWLTTRGWVPGSEVLVSAVTIGDMARVLETHGLVPVPVDVDADTLSPAEDDWRAALTPRSVALLTAHLFGARADLAAARRVADDHGLPLIEDAAQSFTALGDGCPCGAPGERMASDEPSAAAARDEPRADVTLFSFGTIKTATALGGALLALGDDSARHAVATVMEAWPVQRRRSHLARLVRAATLQLLARRWSFGAFVATCRALGVDHDALLGASVRGFPGDDLLTAVRRRPGAPLLALLHRRLAGADGREVAARRARGERLAALLGDHPRPGRRALAPTHWLFPVLSDEPQALIARLDRAGFDATRGTTSLTVLPPPAGHAPARRAEAWFARLVYLPWHAGMSDADITRLAGVVREGPAPVGR